MLRYSVKRVQVETPQRRHHRRPPQTLQCSKKVQVEIRRIAEQSRSCEGCYFLKKGMQVETPGLRSPEMRGQAAKSLKKDAG